MLRTGDLAPDFQAQDQDGRAFRLRDHRGTWVVVYFYPKDETPGCIAEACAFRDSMEDITSMGVVVVGVSTQSVESHRAFANHHEVNYPLLADMDREISRLYGTLGIFGLSKRVTYVIDPEGIIVDVYRSEVRPRSHVERVRDVLRANLQSEDSAA